MGRISLLLLILTSCTVQVAAEESLYETLMKIEPYDNPFAPTQKVSFSRGGAKGVKKDDMILSAAQNDWLFGGNEPWLLQNHTENTAEEAAERRKRAGTKMSPHIAYWTNGVVPYIIDRKHFNQDEMTQLREAMDVYEDVTCLKFVQRTSNDPQWIYLHHTDDGCYSLLGNAKSHRRGAQPISLQDPGCRNFGTYLHEIGHAIGLVHEHQLPTRDRFVRYFGTNVDPEMASQLEIYNARVINTFNTPYDLGSIMHYDVTAFAIDDSSITLGVDNPWLAQHIGRRHSNILSFGDARTVNRLYNCAATCSPAAVKTCPGYLNRRCECLTPQTYHQRYCEDEPGYESWCARITPAGKCDIQDIDHHKKCAKTCGFCPRFMPGDSAIGSQQSRMGSSVACLDRYHNPLMCQRWKGLCASSPWMHRYCRKTCGACASPIGKCPNMQPDALCDRYKQRGYCTMNPTNKQDEGFKEYLKTQCADSCNVCGYRNTDYKCRNKKTDAECKALSRNMMCEKNPLHMFEQCPSECNRCYWNKGNCENIASDKQCIQMGLANYCTHGGKRSITMRTNCPKTCDSCPLQGK